MLGITKLYILCTAFSVYIFAKVNGFIPPNYSKEVINRLKGKTLLNNEEIINWLNFTGNNPYPETYGYNTVENKSMNCYVVYDPFYSKSRYRLINTTDHEAKRLNITANHSVFLTHTGHCGTCSNLDNLVVYLNDTDLTNPVRKCGLKGGQAESVDCLQNIGFTENCSWVWYWNIISTRSKCIKPCLLYFNSTPNLPSGGENYCAPENCPNTINNKTACTSSSWENGKYRINPCLQCDECFSGPIFKKFAGRTRRNSGVKSSIGRDPAEISAVYHYYG